MDAGQRADAGDAEARSAEAGRDARRDPCIQEGDVVVERRVAEQHVEELSRLEPGRLHGDPDPDLELVRRHGHDIVDARDDLGEHARVVDRRKRRLDALLERERQGAGVDVAGGRADAVGRIDPALVDRNDRAGNCDVHGGILVDRLTGRCGCATMRPPCSPRRQDCRERRPAGRERHPALHRRRRQQPAVGTRARADGRGHRAARCACPGRDRAPSRRRREDHRGWRARGVRPRDRRAARGPRLRVGTRRSRGHRRDRAGRALRHARGHRRAPRQRLLRQHRQPRCTHHGGRPRRPDPAVASCRGVDPRAAAGRGHACATWAACGCATSRAPSTSTRPCIPSCARTSRRCARSNRRRTTCRSR